MERVSKNLRRLRKKQNLTQEQLAESLHVTRQAISNWENDKTQPDIASLTQLAEILHVDIEELLYGEKRQVGTEVSAERTNAKLRIILAVAGSLLIGIGLCLIFWNFWQDFPLLLQTAFSFVPVLLAQAFVVYVLLRRNEDVVWRECAALLWCVGVISTVALINSVFNIHFGYVNCLLIDIVLCGSIPYLLRAVSPLPIYLYMVIHWSVGAMFPQFIVLPIAALLLAVGILYPLFLKDKTDVRYKFTLWLSAAAGVAYLTTHAAFIENDFAVLTICGAAILAFLGLYAADRDDSDYSYPYKTLGVTGCAVALSCASSVTWAYRPVMAYGIGGSLTNELSSLYFHPQYILIIAAIVLGIVLTIRARACFQNNLAKILLCSFALAGTILLLLPTIPTVLLWLLPVCALGFGGSLIYCGLDELKLLPANLGLILVFVQLYAFVLTSDISPLVLGIVFLLSGAAIIAVNYQMNARKKEQAILEKAKREQEAANNE